MKRYKMKVMVSSKYRRNLTLFQVLTITVTATNLTSANTQLAKEVQSQGKNVVRIYNWMREAA